MSLSVLESKPNMLRPRAASPNVALIRGGSATLLDTSSPQKSLTGVVSTAGANQLGKVYLAADQSGEYAVICGASQPELAHIVPSYLPASRIFFGVNEPDVDLPVLTATNIFMYGANELAVASVADARFARGAIIDTGATELEKLYVFEDRAAVNTFVLEHRLRGLLAAASEPLNEAFGKATIKTLKIVTDDEGAQTLFCLSLVAASVEDARRSLAAFDERWWLARCGTVAGKLNFDFEFV
jgi:hypothetical protein